jgi:hypothetical protein
MSWKIFKRTLLTLVVLLVVAYPLLPIANSILVRNGANWSDRTWSVIHTAVAPLDWYVRSDLPGSSAYLSFVNWASFSPEPEWLKEPDIVRPPDGSP